MQLSRLCIWFVFILSLGNHLSAFSNSFPHHLERKVIEANLDEYLKNHQVHVIIEGYCTPEQVEQFKTALKLYNKKIRRIAEIGFNAGHSSEMFLETCARSKVVSFDINYHAYTKIGLQYMQKKYRNRLTFIEGDSKSAIPTFSGSNPGVKFDLIYIDGDHSYQGCLTDILNCKALATKDTILWVDDYNFAPVATAINECVQNGHIVIVLHHITPSGDREWIEAKYINP